MRPAAAPTPSGALSAQKLSEGSANRSSSTTGRAPNGNIATEIAVNSPADGYTMIMGNIGPIGVNPHLYKLAFDPIRISRR